MDRPRGNAYFTSALLTVLLACAAAHSRAQPPVLKVVAPLVAPQPPAPVTPPIAPPAPVLKPFWSRYTVEAWGITAGTTDITLAVQSDGRYQYTTAIHPRGLARLVFPSHGTLSTLAAADGSSVRPLRYREEDGTAATDDDVALDFDWSQGIVQGTAHDKPVRLALPANTQDPMSIQLAVLLDFASKREPLRYSMVDKTKIKVYEYKPEGRARLETALGPLDTVIYSSNRPGQPTRLTRVWYAPSLDYTPVRSEDINDGKLRVRMTIQKLTR